MEVMRGARVKAVRRGDVRVFGRPISVVVMVGIRFFWGISRCRCTPRLTIMLWIVVCLEVYCSCRGRSGERNKTHKYISCHSGVIYSWSAIVRILILMLRPGWWPNGEVN